LTRVHRMTVWGITTMTGLWAALQQWQPLIAGLLVLVAGCVTYAGALVAANRRAFAVRLDTDRQVAAMRRAAEQQVAAVRRATDQQVAVVRRTTDQQVASLQAERRQLGERSVEWDVQIKGKRIEIAAVTRDAAPSHGQEAPVLPIAQLAIESSPLGRGEREEMTLLDDRMRAVFEELGGVIDEYYSRAKTINRLAKLARVVEPIER
jgi:hypothetical protein